jgi:hypothetical protein
MMFIVQDKEWLILTRICLRIKPILLIRSKALTKQRIETPWNHKWTLIKRGNHETSGTVHWTTKVEPIYTIQLQLLLVPSFQCCHRSTRRRSQVIHQVLPTTRASVAARNFTNKLRMLRIQVWNIILLILRRERRRERQFMKGL